jgi:hypothetical protein
MVVTGPMFGLVATLLAVVLTAGCSSDSDATSPSTSSTTRTRSTATDLSVDGVATAATGDPTADPAEIPFSGAVDCRADGPTGTGMFATTAAETCAQIEAHAAVLTKLGTQPGRICSEIYGGPQHVRITGNVAGRRVDLEVARSDGCGIADWTALEWLVGAPER